MKNNKKMFLAFILNLFFSIFELVGGIFSGSQAILSDSLHDLGDSISIGIALLLEKLSHKGSDKAYTYGYYRFSLLGSLITTFILLTGSLAIAIHSVKKIINPSEININGMLIFAVIGFIINFTAAFLTKSGESLNEKAVNLHMLEDSLGWAAVLIGALVIKLTGFVIIDPILSLSISVFIFLNALRGLKKILNVFLERTPKDIDISHIKEEILEIEGVKDVHHIHIRSLDGIFHEATMHVVASHSPAEIKREIKHILSEHNIIHSFIETEIEADDCNELTCSIPRAHSHHHHGHHHEHHHTHHKHHH